MYLFSKAQTITNNQIYIPHFMRAALKIHEGSSLTLSSEVRDDSPLENQIILSGIERNLRSDYWNLKVSFRDRPGIVAELCTMLSSMKIEILSCSMITRDQNNEFTVNIDFCARHYSSDFDSDTLTRKSNPGQWPKELYTNILCTFIDEILFRRDGKPQIYIKYNHVLASSVENIQFIRTCKVTNGFVKLPQGTLEAIRSQFEPTYPDVKHPTIVPSAVLSTDYEFNVIIATIFFPNTGYLHVRVSFSQDTSSLAYIASTLSDHEFNILLLNSRSLGNGKRGMVDMLLHLPPEIDRERDDEKLRRWVNAIFSGSKLGRLKCDVSFPVPISSEDIRIDGTKQLISGG
jgi:hypothetical protein